MVALQLWYFSLLETPLGAVWSARGCPPLPSRPIAPRDAWCGCECVVRSWHIPFETNVNRAHMGPVRGQREGVLEPFVPPLRFNGRIHHNIFTNKI